MILSIIFIPLVLILGLPTLLTYYLVRRNKVEYLELPNGKRYAGLWDRFLAGIIDNIILLIIIFFLSAILSQTQVRGGGFWIGFFYYVLQQTSKNQRTLGMQAMKIKIYTENYERVGFWRLSGRYFITLLSGIPLGLGFLMIGWTKRKQGFHDIVARTIHLKEE